MEETGIKFKSGLIAERFAQCLPLLRKIAEVQSAWCADRKVPFLVTDARTTEEEDRKLSRVSKTHREGRAFDLSLRGWPPAVIDEFVLYFNRLYKDVAAFTNNTKLPTLVVRHNSGHGDHLHVQIRRLP